MVTFPFVIDTDTIMGLLSLIIIVAVIIHALPQPPIPLIPVPFLSRDLYSHKSLRPIFMNDY
jgi:hypothetical protein